MSHHPRYPVYVISKGRAAASLTARFLLEDGVDFRLVVEPQERDEYAKFVPEKHIDVLPFSDLGQGSIPARNWVWEDAIRRGAERHWIMDDNMRDIYRRYRGKRVVCEAGPALAAVEDFTDRYENLAISGLNYVMFCPDTEETPAFRLNVHVYSCMLVRNDLPVRWRGRYNEDTDLCLQVLARGWCTALVNAFLVMKVASMVMKGGNTDKLYAGNGRLKMARSLERQWPGVVRVTRKYGRPQHHVNWTRFTTPLKLKPGVVVPAGTDDYGLVMGERYEKGRKARPPASGPVPKKAAAG